MNPICVIPARRGSKRLPKKNILMMNGKPMLAYTIASALESKVFEKVYVSTEDPEIAAMARSFGAHSHLRPPLLAGDLVSATEVCIENYESAKTKGEFYDAIVCLQPSSPLRDASDIRGAWSLFERTGVDYLVSVTFIDPHYFHWAVHKPENSAYWKMYFEDDFLIERPLLPPVFRPNGAIKIAKIPPVLHDRNFFGEKLEVYEMPEKRSIHVATEFDFQIAEFLLSR